MIAVNSFRMGYLRHATDARPDGTHRPIGVTGPWPIQFPPGPPQYPCTGVSCQLLLGHRRPTGYPDQGGGGHTLTSAVACRGVRAVPDYGWSRWYTANARHRWRDFSDQAGIPISPRSPWAPTCQR